jgi:hypothetical protein
MRHLLLLSFFILNFNAFSFTPNDDEGCLVSYKLYRSYDQSGVKALWKEKGIPKFFAPSNYGVDIYEVVYMAPWVDGTMIRASGLYFVPKMKKGEKLPVAVYHHGTQLERRRESFDKSAQQGISFGMAADGYITLMPDYYGIGDGDKVHLYQHAWSEAMSTVYMLFAMDQLNKILGIERKNDIYLTGYSQGGHATMAAHKFLQDLNNPLYKVVASAPLSGAYDMSGVQAEVMFKEYSQPFYLPYLLVSLDHAYDVWDGDIYEIFRSPYDTIIPPFFKGERNLREFNKVLPAVPADMLKPELVQEFVDNPEFPARKKIEKNNLYNWVPEAPMLLCYCEGDEQVYYKNSLVAHDWMTKNGAKDVRLRKLSDVFDHNTCALFAVMDTKYFFENVRNGKAGKKKYGPPLKRMLINIYKRKEEKKFVRKQQEKLRQAESLRAEGQP